ncbi:alpha/beta hydrolase [Kribbella capetownensis]|uniref:Alpha/beta hydrolase n=1 Tax=Kribbella capetownensis TaxID=1572659 RepID=A0A4R0JVA2_9ACTN|nr:alpha/beta hydrolase [Kribbella capetownensis]TCC49118.1 alpha/beta hydrolase [Kribbella capetownensis]
MRFIIVPGWNGSDHHHWQSAWQSRWLPNATRIAPRSWSHPELNDWLRALDVAANSDADGNDDGEKGLLLIAHSVGCYAAVHWLTSEREAGPSLTRPQGPAVRGLFLVAPPDSLAPTFPSDLLGPFAKPPANPISVPAVIVASSDDPYCSLNAATRLAEDWQVPVVDVGPAGHINSDSTLGLWPIGQSLLTSFMAGLGMHTRRVSP